MGTLYPSMRNQHTLRIPSVSESDIGYYFCRGFGNGPYKDTKMASIYIEGEVKESRVFILSFHQYACPILQLKSVSFYTYY